MWSRPLGSRTRNIGQTFCSAGRYVRAALQHLLKCIDQLRSCSLLQEKRRSAATESLSHKIRIFMLGHEDQLRPGHLGFELSASVEAVQVAAS